MCPACLAAMGLYVAGGTSAGGITTYLATRLLRRRGASHAGDRLPGLEAGEPPDGGAEHAARPIEHGSAAAQDSNERDGKE
jgi:hypothetical protein